MTEDSIALWRAAGRRGWGVERMTRFRPPEDFKVDDQPVLYVEALTAPLFAEALGLSLSEPPLDWLPRLPFEFRLRDVSLMNLAEARSLKDPHFIKPPNDKSFRAGVYVGSELPDPPRTPGRARSERAIFGASSSVLRTATSPDHRP